MTRIDDEPVLELSCLTQRLSVRDVVASGDLGSTLGRSCESSQVIQILMQRTRAPRTDQLEIKGGVIGNAEAIQ